MTTRREGDRALATSGVDATLAIVLVGFRFVAAAWLTVLAVIAMVEDDPRLAVVWSAIGVAWIWAFATAWVVRSRPQLLLDWRWLVADLAVGLWTLAAPFLDGVSEAVNFSGGYPISSVLLWTYVWGWRGVAIAVGAAVIVIVANDDYSVNGKITASTVYVVAAATVAWGLGVLRRNEAARLAAEEALAAERAERIRSEERAEVAAHLHDSVLQTLAVVQRRADDPDEVVALARQQERQLRSWLYGDDPAAGDSLAAAIEALGGEIEDRYRVNVEVVTVGDCPLDDPTAAVVHATREALTNAAKWSGAPRVAVYAEVDAERLAVFVRDRGSGFDPAAVDGGRRGIAESIVGRMERHGGTATIRSTPGGGTEVELSMERS